MSKVGRNESCPCSSGKKYKKCCESTALEAAAERARAIAKAGAERMAENALAPPSGSAVGEWFDDELDELSNGAVDLIKEKRFDEALAVCERLRVEYPDVHDWLERSAMVHEARGDTAQAIDFYRRTLAFTELPGLALPWAGPADKVRAGLKDILLNYVELWEALRAKSA